MSGRALALLDELAGLTLGCCAGWYPGVPCEGDAVRAVAVGLVLAISASVLSGTPGVAGAAPSDDQGIAQAGLFVPGDFPTGWTMQSNEPGVDVLACPTVQRAVPALRSQRTITVVSHAFANGGEDAASSVVAFSGKDVVRRLFSAAASTAIRRCAINATLDIGAISFAEPKVGVTALTGLDHRFGDQAAGVRLRTTVLSSAPGGVRRTPLSIVDVVWVRVGRFLGIYSHNSPQAPQVLSSVSVDHVIRGPSGRLVAATRGQP